MNLSTAKKILISLSLCLVLVPVCAFAAVGTSYGFVDIDDSASRVSVSGYVDEYIPGVDEAYLIVTPVGKTIDDFSSSATTEQLLLNMKYIDIVPISSTGSFNASFKISDISENNKIYLSYNGKNIILDRLEHGILTEKSMHIAGTVEYASGYETIQIKILKNGYTYEDYGTYGESAVFATYTDISVDENGKYELFIEDASYLYGGNLIITEYAQNTTNRVACNSEFEIKLYVDAKNGSDTNNGLSKAGALKTIDAAQEIYAAKYAPDGYSIRYIVGEGTYSPMSICDDSKSGATITYEGEVGQGAVFTAATRLELSDFGRVTDAQVLDRLKDTARENVYCLDLGEYGIDADDILGNSTNYRKSCELEMASLYLNGKPQSVAKWPNDRYAQSYFGTYEIDANNDVYSYTFDAENAENWANADVENTYLEGFFTPDKSAWVRNYAEVISIDAENKKIIFDAPHTFRESAVTPGETYYHSGLGRDWPCRYGKITVCHLLEELDIPGEWYVDTKTMMLYYYMPSGISDSDELIITASRESVISGSEVSDVTFKNITITGSNAPLVELGKADNVTFAECILSDGQYGIVIEDGRNNRIDANAMYYIKGNAVWIERGANSTTLAPSANKITNNHIYSCATAGVHGGICADENIRLGYYQNNNALIGEVIENNVIHGNPYGEAVTYIGMEHSISYNEFYNLTNYVSDVGVVYTGNKLNQYGTRIDYNYIHDFEHEMSDDTRYGATPPSDSSAIYWDDYHSGQIAENNIIVADGTTNSRALLSVGKNNTANYNIVVNADKGLKFSDRGSTKEAIETNAYHTFNSVSDALNARYPQILQSKADIDESGKFEPTGNRAHGNMTVDVGSVTSESTVFTEEGSHTGDFYLTASASVDTVSTESSNTTAKTKSDYDDIFIDYRNHDWRLKSEFVSKYEQYLSENLISEDNFDMDSIGIRYNVYNEENPADLSFDLTYPLDNVFENTDTVQLAWEKALFADRYYYEVSTSTGFEDDKIVAKGFTRYTSVEITGLEEDIRYYWRVWAYNDSKAMNSSWASNQERGTFIISHFDYAITNLKLFDSEGNRIVAPSDIFKADYVTYDIVNKTQSEVDYVVILASYNKDTSRLKQILVKEEAKSSAGTVNHRSEVTAPAEADCSQGDVLYMFLWNGTKELAPIARKISIK